MDWNTSVIDVVGHPRAAHQTEAAEALISGFEQHGVPVRLRLSHHDCTAPVVACWGWRNAKKHRADGRRVLVMERGYVGDRFAWYSLAWDGLNGYGGFAGVDDPSRWREHFGHLMQPWHSGRYALILGQVPTDQSVAHMDYRKWVIHAIAEMRGQGWDVKWRPHPISREVMQVPCETLQGTLEGSLAGAGVAVAFNSNSAVDAVLAGTPTLVCDRGSMAWPVAGHGLGSVPFTGDRQPWADRLAWCQWRAEEIADGTAWGYLKEAFDGRGNQVNWYERDCKTPESHGHAAQEKGGRPCAA